MARDSEVSARLDVMMLPNASNPGGNPFVGLLVESLDPRITTIPFSWLRAFRGDYDHLHAHWPEYVVSDRSPVRRLLRSVALLLLMVRMRVSRIPWSVSMHNERAHDGLSALSSRAISRFIRDASIRVFLNESDRHRQEFRADDLVIKHGDYAAAANVTTLPKERKESTLLLFGGLRSYKGIEALIEAAREAPELTLRIRGRAHTPEYGDELRQAVGSAPNIDLLVGELSQEELSAEIASAALVVLPYPNFYNSGAAFLSLTLGAPLLVTETPTSRELREEFGRTRIQLFTGRIGAEDLRGALDVTEGSASGMPRSLGEDRAWSKIGRQYSSAFLDARARRRTQ
ncbi:hypothetical protein P2A57_23160 [Xanthomonas perforans]